MLVDLGSAKDGFGEEFITAGEFSIFMGIEMLSVSKSCFLGAKGENVDILSNRDSDGSTTFPL